LNAAISLARAFAAAGQPENGNAALRQAVEAFGAEENDVDAGRLAAAREILSAQTH
jgi:hypothetical protein